MSICEGCGEDRETDEYEGEMLCFECVKEALDYDEGQLFVRDMLHNN